MRTEEYSTNLISDFASVQSMIEQEHGAVADRSFNPAGRGARVVNANRRIDSELSRLQKRADAYYDEDFTKVYRAGSQETASHAAEILKGEQIQAPIPQKDRSHLSYQRKKGKAELRSAIEQTRARSRATMGQGGELKTVHGGKRMYKLDSYANLSVNAKAADAYNRGSLESARTHGFTQVKVVDGPGCGWTEHSDPDGANDKIVDIDEALAHTVAHPYCGRQFVPEPGEGGPKGGGLRAKKIAKNLLLGGGAAAGAVAAQSLYANRAAVLKAINSVLLTGTPEWKVFDLQIRAFQRELERLTTGPGADILDIRTGKNLSSRPIDIAQRAMDDAVNYERGVDVNLSPGTMKIMGINDKMDRVETVAQIRKFDEFLKANKKANMSDSLLSSYDQVEQKVRTEFMDEVVNLGSRFTDQASSNLSETIRKTRVKIVRGPSDRLVEKAQKLLPGNDSFRLTLPRIDSADGSGLVRSLRARVDIGNFIRTTTTQRIGSTRVGSGMVNRNGLFRLGFQMGKDRVIYPRLSIVPKAPIRILSRLNRGADGSINSVSGQLRVLVPGPFNPSMNFNIDLRSLQLADMWDIRSLTMKEVAGLGWDNFRIRSIALESRFRLMNTFDVHDIFRMKWEDVKSLWTKSNYVLTESGEIERTRGITMKIRAFEQRYFGDFMEDAGNNFEKFRRVASRDMKEYYEEKIENAMAAVKDIRESGFDIIKDEYDRQKAIVKGDLEIATKYLEMVKTFVTDFDPVVARKWIKVNSQEALDEFTTYATQLPAKTVSDTLQILNKMHHRLFVELPAQKRRRAFRVVGMAQDEMGDMFDDIVRNMSWTERIKAWGSDILPLANKYDLSTDQAVGLLDKLSRSIGRAARGVEGYTRGMGQSDVARLISRHAVNAKKRLQDVVDWQDFFSRGDRAIEAYGDFGEWVSRIMDRARKARGSRATYDNVFEKATKDLGKITHSIREDAAKEWAKISKLPDNPIGTKFVDDPSDKFKHLKGDLPDLPGEELRKLLKLDYRDLDEIYDIDQLAEEAEMLMEGDGIPFEKDGSQHWDKMRAILTNMHKSFGLKDLKIHDAEGLLDPLPDEYGGMYYPGRRTMSVRSSMIRGDAPLDIVKQIWQSAFNGHHSPIRIDDEMVGTLQHELGHAVDMTVGGTYNHVEGLVRIMMEEIPNLVLPDGDLTSDQRLKMKLFDKKLANGQIPVDTFFMNETQRNNYLYLYRIMSLNQEQFQGQVSLYGATQPVEMVAELFRHAMLADDPSRLSLRVVNWLLELSQNGATARKVGF